MNSKDYDVLYELTDGYKNNKLDALISLVIRYDNDGVRISPDQCLYNLYPQVLLIVDDDDDPALHEQYNDYIEWTGYNKTWYSDSVEEGMILRIDFPYYYDIMDDDISYVLDEINSNLCTSNEPRKQLLRKPTYIYVKLADTNNM